MQELESIHDLKMVISQRHDILVAILETVVASWLEYGSCLGAINVQLLIIDDYQKLDHPYRGAHPFLYFYPERSDINPPKNGFHDATPLFGYPNYERLNTDYKKLVIMNKVKSLLNNQAFMDKEAQKYEAAYGQIIPVIGPEERLLKTFVIEFSDNYEKSFLSISLAKQLTRNRWD